MGLSDAISSMTTTPYCSHLPIDAIPPVDMPNSKQEPLLTAYHQFLSMPNWLSLSTHPDLTTAHSLLAITTAAPTQGHLNAICYIGQYIKATADYVISFSSSSNDNLKNFITFPLPDHNSSTFIPTAFTDANWGPQDASASSPKNI